VQLYVFSCGRLRSNSIRFLKEFYVRDGIEGKLDILLGLDKRLRDLEASAVRWPTMSGLCATFSGLAAGGGDAIPQTLNQQEDNEPRIVRWGFSES
jgi:hypothetical protein